MSESGSRDKQTIGSEVDRHWGSQIVDYGVRDNKKLPFYLTQGSTRRKLNLDLVLQIEQSKSS